MQLQVECNGLTGKQQSCWTCDRSFNNREARVILCNDQGANCGEVCPDCLDRGFHWLQDRFDQLHILPKNSTQNAVLKRSRQRAINLVKA